MEKIPEAVASMRAAVAVFDKLIAERDATAATICDAASAYGTLGDELGQPGTPSMGDLSGALAIYRKVIGLEERALALDTNFVRARRAIAVNELKVGNVEMLNDPAQALKDFQIAQERFEALPDAKRESLSSLRMRANLVRKRAMSMRELAEFAQAVPLFDEALAIQKKIAAQDPKDSRSQFDVYVDLTQASYNYEEAADPVFSPSPWQRRRNLELAVPLLEQAESIVDELLKMNPANDDWKVAQADVQVRLGTAEEELGKAGGAALSVTGVATLKELAARHADTALVLDHEVSALLSVKPDFLRDPQSAVAAAELEALVTKRREPEVLLWVAQAHRMARHLEQAHAAAREGLSLLPQNPGNATPESRVGRLLRLQAE